MNAIMNHYEVPQEYIAELSDEERQSIQQLVERHSGTMDLVELRKLVLLENSLCLEEDVHEEFVRCIVRSKITELSPDSQELQRVKEEFRVNAALRTSDSARVTSRNWSERETAILNKYLARNKGRKNWVLCAKLIGTKTSVQCKAKYNNSKAAEGSVCKGSLDYIL
ncbi:hypothetical protein GGI06_004229 [Coemansia sp. S85]|nr:hypothetical protein GGI06_004229 [Coemansia sp. S85]